LGHPIIMGRVTYLSIGRPLPWRRNIVISRESLEIPWVEVFSDIDWMLNVLETEWVWKIFICGGSQIYTYFFRNHKIDRVILSVIDGEYEGDAFFPEFEELFHKIDSTQKEGFVVNTFLKN
jgi:dihydrofolate reductase